ncbi:hypothetical protein RHS01_00464 [Rhizoctonia solani]|uniref:Uncharacterized protein n=1 Tax=Rhizoctonia solani TaxID=456999 RepID=A0A8H7ILV8_9AGAM|nr:hypothetical protein RHS01_00464 [Rhizoctonia solani]
MNSPDIYSDMSADGGEHAQHVNDSAHFEKSKPDPSGSQFMADDPNTVDMGIVILNFEYVKLTSMRDKHQMTSLPVQVRTFRRDDSNMKPRDFLTSTPYITICRDDRGVSDVSNTFKIIYASVIDGPFSFDAPILISALRISSVYGFNNLRAFAIQHLEKMSLGPAYKELSDREKAITEEEAGAGIRCFYQMAREREEAMLKRGKVLGEQEHKGKLKKEQEKAKKEAEGKAKKAAEEKQRKKLNWPEDSEDY